jgi:hypothetical protein
VTRLTSLDDVMLALMRVDVAIHHAMEALEEVGEPEDDPRQEDEDR